MKLLRTSVWSPYAIASLKLCCLLLGMVAGAYFPEFVKNHVPVVVLCAALFAVRPLVTYFHGNE